jgi:UDP-2,3-diacylglucosamine hydrolase
MSTLFISDLHLDPARPDISDRLLGLLRTEARRADALYILGDLFEAWLGDDDPEPLAAAVAGELRDVADAGVPIGFIHGNRDFLLGHDYAARCGMRLLPDPTVIDLYGEPTLLMHGDLLCTEDAGYQAFRRQVRDPRWINAFLAQPLQARQQFARQARAASAEHQAGVDQMITDVSGESVRATLRLYGVRRLIHGHTHRPAEHAIDVDGRCCERIVLADWHERGEVLIVNRAGAVQRQTL